jgi:hypothetical protein
VRDRSTGGACPAPARDRAHAATAARPRGRGGAPARWTHRPRATRRPTGLRQQPRGRRAASRRRVPPSFLAP